MAVCALLAQGKMRILLLCEGASFSSQVCVHHRLVNMVAACG